MLSEGRNELMDFPKPSEMVPVTPLHTGPKRLEDAKLGTLSGRRQSSVNSFRNNGFSDDELKTHGRLYRKMSAQLREEFFPGKSAKFTKGTKYTFDDLKKDAPDIVKGVLTMPNVTNVDVQALHAGTAHRSDFPMVPVEVLK